MRGGAAQWEPKLLQDEERAVLREMERGPQGSRSMTLQEARELAEKLMAIDESKLVDRTPGGH